MVLHEPGGERMICTARTCGDCRRPSTRPGCLPRPSKAPHWAVITNVGFARPLLAVARDAGVPVAADVQAIDDLDDDYNRDWMAAAQVLFCSHERLPVPQRLWISMVQERYRTPVVVVGGGAGGALLGVRDGGEIRHVPAVAPRGVTSTAGAGDALAAAFMHVYAATGDPQAAIEQAVVFAVYAVGGEPGDSAFLTGPSSPCC